MNARAYFTILRPIRTLLFAAFYAWALGFNLLKIIGGASLRETNFLTLVAITPVFLGFFLLGPLHEVMHRSFSVLLPAARNAFLRWHLRAITVAALLLLGAAEFCHFEFPRAASLGFILAGLSLPLLNERTAPPYSGWYKLILGLTACAFIASPARVHLIEAGRAMPWLILTAGAACALFCFRHGFSVEGIRARSGSPQLFFCLQSSFPLLGSGGFAVTRYMATENGRLLAARKADRTGRDWSVTSVGPSLREWAAVVHHSRFGGTKLRQILLGLLAVGLSPIAMVAIVQLSIGRIDPRNEIPITEICRLLAESFRLGTAPEKISTLFFLFAPLFALILSVSLVSIVAFNIFRFPLSRHRLAHCIHLEAVRLNALIAATFALVLIGIAIGFALLSGHSVDWTYLSRPIAAGVLLFPASMLVQALIYQITRYRWLMLGGNMIPVLIVSALAGFLGAHFNLGNHASRFSPVVLLDALFTPTGLAICLAVTGLTTALHWLALRRHFRTCDLARPLPWAARAA